MRANGINGEDILTGAAVNLAPGKLKICIKGLCETGSLVPHHLFDALNAKCFAAATKAGARFKNTIKQNKKDIIEKINKCKSLLKNMP